MVLALRVENPTHESFKTIGKEVTVVFHNPLSVAIKFPADKLELEGNLFVRIFRPTDKSPFVPFENLREQMPGFSAGGNGDGVITILPGGEYDVHLDLWQNWSAFFNDADSVEPIGNEKWNIQAAYLLNDDPNRQPAVLQKNTDFIVSPIYSISFSGR